jgi:hypothetical protein
MLSSHYLKKKKSPAMLNFAQGLAPTNERDTHLVVRPSVRPASQGTNRKAETTLAFRPR